MTTSAEGIVEKAATFSGKVRRISYIRIQVHNMFGLQESKPFRIEVGNETIEGETTDKGAIEIAVPKGATEATLYIDDEVYELELVDDQPTDTIEWIQTRLSNLGFYYGAIDGDWGPQSRAAMKSFQEIHELEPTGIIDKESLDLLEKLHDEGYEPAEEEEEEPEEDEFPEEDISEETEEDQNEGPYPEDDPSYFE